MNAQVPHFTVPVPHSEEIRRCILLFLCTLADVHGDRSTTTAEHVQRWCRRRSFSFLSFCFLHLVVVASSLLALSSGSLLLSERMTVLVSFSRQSHTGVLQLWSLFLLVLGLKKKAPKRMVLKIDRRVGGSFFFLSSPLEVPAIRLEGILLLTPSLVGLCNTPGIHNKLAGN